MIITLTHSSHSVLPYPTLPILPCLRLVFAGYVSLVNAARARKGKPPIGFVNKMLYDIGAKNSSFFNDVTEGHNKCCAQSNSNKAPICCTTGFESGAGWDPVVSTPSYPIPSNVMSYHDIRQSYLLLSCDVILSHLMRCQMRIMRQSPQGIHF